MKKIFLIVLMALFAVGSVSAVTITDCAGLQAMDTNLSDNYVLENDINCNVAPYNAGLGFSPIGKNFTLFFSGTFDGQGNTITGLMINRPAQDKIGLFGHTQSAVIKNVALINVNITGKNYVGALEGYGYASTVTNSSSSGIVNGTGHVGGLIGAEGGYGNINSSYSTANVNGELAVGGFIGYIHPVAKINNVYAKGNVTGITSVGGLAGGTGNLRSAYATGTVTGIDQVGGLVGVNSGEINDSYATGDVNGNSSVGGLAGKCDSGGDVRNSYSTGNVNGILDDVGGLVGITSGDVEGCFATGLVSFDGNGDVGGLIGSAVLNSSVNNSYWDICRTNQTVCCGDKTFANCFGENGGGSESTYFYNTDNEPMQGWDKEIVWSKICSQTDGYPILLGIDGQICSTKPNCGVPPVPEVSSGLSSTITALIAVLAIVVVAVVIIARRK